VLFTTWYDGLAPLPADAQLSAADFDQLLALREQVAKVLEPMRANGVIGAALDAEIEVPPMKGRPRAGSRWPGNCGSCSSAAT
jgi:isoleucyl-tRNA synthetase